MADIQIDMFEVQLGAGILIQFAISDEPPVRIIADAGVHASGYQADHVLRKLPASFRDFDPTASPTIDLMLGTHYDKDHLDGLVDIARDPNIHISEAWLPPVANDARPSFEVPLSDDDLLPNQLASDKGDRIFDHYLCIQRNRCEEALSREREILSLTQVWESEDQSDEDDIGAYVRSLSELAEIGFPDLREENRDARAAAISYFEHQCRSAEALIPGRLRGLHAEEFHLDETADDSVESAEFLLHERLPFWDWMFVHRDPDWRLLIRSQPELARQRLTRLALIRRSSATKAITAASLNRLVKALMDRKITIKSETIQPGQPEYFVWGRRRRSFGRVSRGTSESQAEPRLVLLGPSRQLVRKHRDLLPTASYLAAAMSVAIPIRSITPSNQLSYVVKLEHKRLRKENRELRRALKKRERQERVDR